MNKPPKSNSPNHLSRRRCLSLFFKGSAAGLLPIAQTLDVIAQESGGTRKRIYIAADDHTDYMWTADEAEYREVFLETLDYYLELIDKTDDHQQDFQCRWNCDGLLWLREYELNKTKPEVKRLVSRIKSGHISIPMTMLVSFYGGMPTEAAIRSLYYGGIVERKYALRLEMAASIENQTLPYGLGMLWAGSGVKYSWKGICGCASKIKHSGSQREHDVYWWVGPDGSRILMKWYSMGPPLRNGIYSNEGPGGYAEARYPELAIKHVDTNPQFKQRNPHSVFGLFGQGWDDLKTIVPLKDPKKSFPAVAKKMTNETRRIIVSNERDYFEDMESTHGKDLPEQSCSFGNEWELYTASLAEVSASVRRATEKLRAAEAMAALVTPLEPGFGTDLTELREQAWVAFGLYWEHDWTADGPISRTRRANWQREIAKQINDYVDTLHSQATESLGRLIKPSTNPDDAAKTIFVFNPLDWKRTDVVDIPFNGENILSARIENDPLLIDAASRKPVPQQIDEFNGQRVLRFTATDVPACGYRLYELQDSNPLDRDSEPSHTKSKKVQASENQAVSATDEIRVSDDGAIVFWRSKKLNRTLIDEGQVGNHLEAAKGQVTVESSGAVSTTLRVDVARPTKRTTRFTLFDAIDRIEIENTIKENFSATKTWRYEFNLDSPKTIHEEVGAVIRAASQSEGGDYADRNARTDWLTMNHFVTVADAKGGVTISNRDCIFFHLGDKTDQPMDSDSSVIEVLVGGQIDGPKLGIQKQGGDRRFTQRFAITSCDQAEATDRTASMRFALEHQNPFVVGEVDSNEGVIEGAEHSMLTLESDHVLLWALKPSESSGAGQGTIVRLWNLSEKPASYVLSMKEPIQACMKTTHVETDVEPMNVVDGKVTEELPPGAMRTLRVTMNKVSS